jgi:hypothetical protein
MDAVVGVIYIAAWGYAGTHGQQKISITVK